MVANHLVYVQSHALLGAANDDHVLRALAAAAATFFAARLQLQQSAQPKELQNSLTKLVTTAGVSGGHFGIVGAAHRLDQGRRHRHHHVAAAQHHHLRHGGGQRQHQLERRALAAGARRFNAPADGVHIGAHHVHANAPAGQLGDAVGGGKTGGKNQAGELRVVVRRLGIEQASGHGLVAYALQVQASAVVAKFNAHFIAALGDQHCNRAHSVFAGRRARLRQLDAVGHAVAQQMLERSGHALQHAAVYFDRAADNVQTHLLAGFFRGLAHHAVQPVRKAFKLDHAGAQQVVLQIARQSRLGGQFVLGFFQSALHRALHGGHVVDRLGHHAGEFLKAREAVKLQRIEALRRDFGSL